MTLSYQVRPLDTVPGEVVEQLLDAAFGPDRHRRTAYRLRAGTEAIATLSAAALDPAGRLIGSIQCWPVALFAGTAAHPMTLVGPVAVAPALQGQGIGRALMAHMLAAADDHGEQALVLIGDPPYYGRFGFSAAATGGWTLPGPFERHRLLARLAPGTQLPRSGEIGPDAPPALRRAGRGRP